MEAEELANVSKWTKKIISDYLEKGNTTNSLAVEAKVHPSQIWLFMQGKRGLTDSSLEKIGAAIAKKNKKNKFV